MRRLICWRKQALVAVVAVAFLWGSGCGSSELEEIAGDPEMAAAASPPDSSPLLGDGRPAPVYLPAAYDARESWPLLILLHGYRATGAVQDAYLGVSKRVDSDGFVLVIPDGTRSAAGFQFWNATEFCCDFEGQNPDDATYIRGLVNEAKLRFSIDERRVYLLGHSNGGFMAYRMACEAGDIITAIASLAGTTFTDDQSCSGTGPVSVLQIHGTADRTIAYEGNRYYPGAVETVERWRARNHCGEFEDKRALGLVSSLAGEETSVRSAAGCDEDTTVELWTVAGGAHVPFFQPAFMEQTLQFLLGHQKP
jgi:polyhydroxybutyrate depolymerase